MNSSSSETGPASVNNTVKLYSPLRERVIRAMEAEGFNMWSEFCRVALTEKCRAAEKKLLDRDPAAYLRIYYKRKDLAGDGSDGG
jgi:hypothetical protein